MNLRILALAFASLLSASFASAADFPARANAPVFTVAASAPNWTGFYVGITAGGAFSDKSKASAAYEDGTPFEGSISSKSGSGVTFGGTLGYNQQIGNFVAGIEGDYSFLNLSQTSRVAYSRPSGSPSSPATYNVDGSVRSSIDSYGTVRGRIGYLVTPELLVYGTGGVAFADVKTRANVSEGVTMLNSNQTTTFGEYAGQRSAFKTGFAYGGGLEYKIDKAWSVKVEALRVQLPKSTVFAGNETDFGYGFRKIKNDFTVVKAGLNYQF